MNQIIQVVIATPDNLARIGLCSLFNTQADLKVVADTLDLQQVQPLCTQWQPNVVLLSTDFPQADLLTCMQALQSLPIAAYIVILASDCNLSILPYLQANARSCVLRNDAIETLLAAVRAVTAGGHWFSTQLIHQLTNNLHLHTKQPLPLHMDILTTREYEVACLLACGYENQQIAKELAISERTTRFHIRNICDKLQLQSRGAAIIWMLQHLPHPIDKQQSKARSL